MSIRLAFVLRFDSGMEVVDMDDQWLRQTADRIKADIAAKKLKDEKFVETQS